MIDFAAVEDAIRTWVLGSSGLDAQHVIFDSQDGLAPTGTFITIRLGDVVQVGIDGVDQDYSALRPVGQEIRKFTTGMRTMVVTLQVFTDATTGSATARTLAEKVKSSLALNTYLDPLNTAGLGVLNTGDVRWIPEVEQTRFEGRAMVEVKMAIPQGLEEFTGYITKVEITPTLDGEELDPEVVEVKGSDPYDDFFHRHIP